MATERVVNGKLETTTTETLQSMLAAKAQIEDIISKATEKAEIEKLKSISEATKHFDEILTELDRKIALLK